MHTLPMKEIQRSLENSDCWDNFKKSFMDCWIKNFTMYSWKTSSEVVCSHIELLKLAIVLLFKIHFYLMYMSVLPACLPMHSIQSWCVWWREWHETHESGPRSSWAVVCIRCTGGWDSSPPYLWIFFSFQRVFTTLFNFFS